MDYVIRFISIYLFYASCVSRISYAMPKPNDNRSTRGAPPRIGLADAARYLRQYGYVSESKTSQALAAIQDLEPSALSSPIREFQRMAGLEETGSLDGETMRYMVMPRCGVEDTLGAFSLGAKGFNAHGRGHFESKRKRNKGSRRTSRKGKGRGNKKGKRRKSRTKRYDLQGSRWEKKKLTYSILNYTPDMTKAQIRTAIRKALKLWEGSTALRFTETANNDEADITVSFGKHSHGDRYPFDGEGGTLAHAFFPQSGVAHFDDDETFSDKGQGTNLYIVAAHEFGHSLGLGHSTVQNSLMAPFYQGYVEDFELDPDDVAAIQKLYGKRVNDKIERPVAPRTTALPRKTKPTKKPRTNEPKTCSTNVNAVISYMNKSDVTYAFKGRYFYKINDFEVVPGYPKKIGKHWENLPGNLNAATHSTRTGRTYFFKGDKVYVYRGTRLLSGYPRNVADLRLPSHPAAVLSWGANGMIYIFKKKNYYVYDELRRRVYKPKRTAGTWKGVPEGIDAAFTWSRNGKTYFIKGNDYYRFNDNNWRVDDGYPRNFNRYWFGCNKPSNVMGNHPKPNKRKGRKKNTRERN